ncbi:MAG: heme exporter protein CcmB, partial [Leptospiraceae bacterium]|nr:heme exporter protein CcmB [Leptospiraceae bacterium]
KYALGDTLSLSKIEPIGLKWAISFIVSYIIIGQSVWEERESGAYRILRGILPPYSYYIVKSLFIFLILVFLEIFIILLFSVFFKEILLNLQSFQIGLAYIVPGTLGISFLGVALSSLSQSTRLKEMLLPVLQTPLVVPVFLFGMNAEKNSTFSGIIDYKPILLLCFFSLFYGSLGAFILEMDTDT